eukprot:TRINITY_DN994_c0_g1_i2.p1 TRINITY_DN994_c0_g1~~TRINITY_DN994_c0_g1_i2.p1  ORF type:complete len:166 (-),score=46.49 TRINITY_DN994_c0_g1_i2:420-917(-)
MSKVVLQDRDEKTYEVDYEVAVMCETIKALMPEAEEEEDVDYSSTPIPLPAVEAQHLELILDWCKTELAHKDEKEDLKKARNHEFFEDKDDSTIFAIILGANYLDCKELLKAGVYHVAGILHKLSPKQIWERYNPDKPLPTKEEIDKIFEDPQLEWAAMPDFTWE